MPGTRPVPVEEHSTVRKARDSLAKAADALAQAHAEAAAPIPDPDKPARANATDPPSRTVPGKNGGGFLQGYNLQAMATRVHQFITSIGIHDSPNDTAALHPNLQATRANLNAAGITDPIGAALFDAGYASHANFTTPCPDEGTTLLVAVHKEARQTGRDPDHPSRATRTTLPSWQDMATRLDTDDGRRLYRQRAVTIEPVFGQLINRLGRWLNYRGEHVDTELHLWAASHNIGKIIKYRPATA